MLPLIYWCLIPALTLVQLFFTFNALGTVTREGLLESVTSVYFFAHNSIYYGAYTNVGWYMVLLIVYKLFGFSLFTAQFFRILLYSISIICLALTLKKYFGVKKALIPLITIGLSPTLLYYTSLQAQYGIDLQYFPICLYLIDNLKPKNDLFNLLKSFFAWMVVMVAWLSYPTFIYYLPILGFFYFFKRRHLFSIKQGVFCLAGFLLPLFFVFIYIQNRQILLYDPHVSSGIFRGAGSLNFKTDIWAIISGLANDLFVGGKSYFFVLKYGEFSHFFPILALIVLAHRFFFVKSKLHKNIFLLLSFSMLLNFLVGIFTQDPSNMPGIRRFTPLLAGIYGIFTLVWVNLKVSQKTSFLLTVLLLLVIPFHHIVVIPSNLSSLEANLKQLADPAWPVQNNNPEYVLSTMVDAVQKARLKLYFGAGAIARYSEIYSAIQGSCEWNRLRCYTISVSGPENSSELPLSIELWNKYELIH